MITKLVIFGLLCSTVVQTFPSSNEVSGKDEGTSSAPDVNPGEQKIPCAQQLEWLQNTTLGTKKQYDDYYAQLKDHNVDVKDFDEVKAQHEKINQLVSDSFKRYTADLEKLRTAGSDIKAQWAICLNETKEFGFLNKNLSALTQNIRPKVLEFAKDLGLSPKEVDDLDHTLGRIVNFMFIVDMGKNTIRDLYSMVEEADIKATEGIKLEEKYEFTEEGVEAIGKLEGREMIGHVEKPAVPTNPWDKPGVDIGIDDIIKPDPAIANADAELTERERLERESLEKARLEEERLEKERLEKERLEKERLLDEMKYKPPQVIFV